MKGRKPATISETRQCLDQEKLKSGSSNRPSLRVIFATLAILSFLSVTTNSRASGVSESVLWSFGNGSDGNEPVAGLIMDSNGNLYSTTDLGGANSAGTVFELMPPSSAGGDWTESILWSFGSGTDGNGPVAGLIMDANGNLFGTTGGGGAFASQSQQGGTVFELTPNGAGWDESILWSFGNAIDGSNPQAGLIMDASGNLFGTTAGGGDNEGGTVFELIPPSTIGGPWTESILWSFGSGKDGFTPEAGAIMDKSGNLYGTTLHGGSAEKGTVFELTPPATSGEPWSESVLWSFGSVAKDGLSPAAGVIMDSSGHLFGTTTNGGANLSSGQPFVFPGTAFELTPPSSAGEGWTESTIWSFGKGKDGLTPEAGLIMDQSGILYGTTAGGGDGAGTVFSLTPPRKGGGKWTETIVWSIVGNPGDGATPSAGLIADPSGNFYSTTIEGGDFGHGTVFEVSSALTATPSRINFGNVAAPGSSKPKKFTLTNEGTVGAHIANVSVTAPFKIGTGANTCSRQSIALKKTCSFYVEFAPTTIGPVSGGSLNVTYNGASPAVALEGTGIAKK
jgi:uncharacterized repeat protein (TIGR03803 family)